ncbi:CP2 transcription factor-domain-containing protein [Tuber indicum]|nr:CP2 transcription factor-domain-containing protein [Tuber indicum]
MDLGDGGDEILPEPGPLEGPVMGPTQLLVLEGKQYDHELGPIASSERFRFNVILNAPTAMIKHPDEIPVTYLNKGQAYAISILDTTPPLGAGPMRYRTYVRISFHDETQRSRPASCWQLWKEGRGTNEAHQRGGKLQAVEYVEASSQPEDDKKKGRVDIETASFDSFAVIWSPPPSGSPEASVSVRFNFLSTDFSHSKGVKGIPVRLCAKTEVLSSGSPQSPPEQPEICFCKVKLFRDHGAERKLANDILHVKKTIEKLKQQANQVEGTGMKAFGKKGKKDEDSGKPGKALKHKRTWSMSSASSVGGVRAHEEDTNAKLASMQDMFTSTRAVSVLYLRGSEIDDPDLHPVHLPGEVPEISEDVWARRRSSVATTNTTASSFVSPTPSSASQSSQRGDAFNSLERRDWEREFQPLPPPQQQSHHPGVSDAPVRVKPDAAMLSGWIEAIGIDSSYNPPPERLAKPVMSIYILPVPIGSPPQANQYHRAVYLQARTSSCLATSIASKCGIDPSAVLRTVHLNSSGLTILVDDEFVREMPEGQDMKVQATEIREESPFASPPQESEGEAGAAARNGWELRLIY